MKALSNQLLVQSMRVKKEQEESEKMESQFQRFFSSLKEANSKDVYAFVTGISPLCLTDFTSGWNHAVTISSREDYADLYGLTHQDIEKGIAMIQPAIPSNVGTMLLDYCKDHYDGYFFHPNQTKELYNPGRIVYFLHIVRSRWLLAQGKQFTDNQDLFRFLGTFL
jgi:hypothetical protein